VNTDGYTNTYIRANLLGKGEIYNNVIAPLSGIRYVPR